jgi:hypothetical protein
MRSSFRAAWLSVPIFAASASLAQAQSLKAENAQVQDKFIVVKSVDAPSDGWLVAHKNEAASRETSLVS